MENEIRMTKLASCAGCGAKVGAGVLAKLLDGIKVHHDPNLLVGFDKSDDASVYKISDELAIVQTVDFFPPIADDPYLFGQIAATNALSDVYAMGKLLEVMLGAKNGKHNRQEKWLRRISWMATHTERQRRIPDMKTFRRLLSAMNASGRVRRQVFKESDFYYIRKLYCP